MKRILLSAVSVVFIFCFFTLNVSAEILGNIYGRVIDKETKEPIEDVVIQISNVFKFKRALITTTNSKGEFFFRKVPTNFDLYLYVFVMSETSPKLSKYYSQQFELKVKIPRNSNLYLKPIEIEKGVKVTGFVKLWDGTPINSAVIDISLKKQTNKIDTIFVEARSNESGFFRTQLMPLNIDLRFEVSHLFSSDGKICYGNVTKIFKIEKGKPTDNFNIFIPNIPTEIRGLVTDFNNNPISNQKITLYYGTKSLNNSLDCRTDKNGKFIFRYIQSGLIKISLPYDNMDSLLFLKTKKIELNNDESIEFLINLNSSDFRYTIVRKSFSK